MKMLIKKTNMSGLVTTTVLNRTISEVENKIPDTISLVTTAVLNEVKNKMFDHAKYVTMQECNQLTAEDIEVRLKQANLVSKTDFDNKLISFNRWFFLRQNLFYK